LNKWFLYLFFSPGLINYNHTFENLKIVPIDLTNRLDLSADSYTIASNNITEYNITIGNATYVDDNLPSDQEGRVFLLEEEEGVNETLENISSNASGVILIKDNIQGWPFSADTSKCNVSVISRVYESDKNISVIVELLQNGTNMTAHNLFYGEGFNFSYNFSFTNWCWCENDFFYVTPHGEYTYDFWDNPSDKNIRDQFDNNYARIIIRNVAMGLFGSKCRGIIAYDDGEIFEGKTHLMWPPVRGWPGWSDSKLPWDSPCWPRRYGC